MKRVTIFLLATIAFLFTQCSTAPRPDLTSPRTSNYARPDSVRAKLILIIPRPDSSVSEVDGVLWAVPEKSYRLELSGPMGIQVASLLWKPEAWTALAYLQERYVVGQGPVLTLPGVPMPDISIHRLFSFAWGETIPDGSDTAKPFLFQNLRMREWKTSDGLQVRSESSDATDKLQALVVRGVSPDQDLRLEYHADTVRISRAGTWLLSLCITERKPNVKWSAGIGKLTIPEGWKAVGAL